MKKFITTMINNYEMNISKLEINHNKRALELVTDVDFDAHKLMEHVLRAYNKQLKILKFIYNLLK